LYLQPYVSGAAIYNRLVLAFDNFNPDLTYVLFDDMQDGSYKRVNVSVQVTRSEFIYYARVDDAEYDFLHIDRSSANCTDAPVGMFLNLPITRFRSKSNTLTYARLTARRCSDEQMAFDITAKVTP
jgi:hypothetical protein